VIAAAFGARLAPAVIAGAAALAIPFALYWIWVGGRRDARPLDAALVALTLTGACEGAGYAILRPVLPAGTVVAGVTYGLVVAVGWRTVGLRLRRLWQVRSPSRTAVLTGLIGDLYVGIVVAEAVHIAASG